MNLNGNGERELEPGTTDVSAHGDGECPEERETATATGHGNIEAQTGGRPTDDTAAAPTTDPPKPNSNGQPPPEGQPPTTGSDPPEGQTPTPTQMPTGGHSPPCADADEPTVADPAPGVERPQKATVAAAPGGSDSSRPPRDEGADRPPPGPVPPGIALDPQQMAGRVYATIYPGGTEEAAARHLRQRVGEFQAREMGTFCSAWANVLSLGLPDVQVAALYQRAIKEAEATARKRIKPKKSRGAVWVYWLNAHMADMVGRGWKRGGNRAGKERKR